MRGAELGSLKLQIEQQPGSLVIEYKKVNSQK